jgi:multidrug resistance efflux pump
VLSGHPGADVSNNCFIGQIRTVTAQNAVAEQRKGMDAMAAQLKGQAAQIHKVSAKLEASKFATGRIRRGGPVPQVPNNP